jgi:Asp-tRNA(Asn)/Glu-tRNA(Gln) amidotransferase B subunit
MNISIILKFLTEEILKLHTKELNFFNDRTYYIFTEIDKVNKNILAEVKNVVCFFPSLITEQDGKNLSDKILNSSMLPLLKNKNIYVLSLFSSTSEVDTLIEVFRKEEISAKITTLYYSNELLRFSTILKYGVDSDNVEHLNRENFLLSCENYCDYFKNMSRRYFN